jgi:tetratricopeptide (TPR) repeat protein
MAVFLGRSRWLVAVLVAAAGVTGAPRAHADDVDAQLAAYENEARQLGVDLPRPNHISGAAGQRRLLDAEVAYSLGDYDAAALMLFELATRPGADRETANFYLAESLFQKGDRGAARGYYEQVVAGGNVASKYYQPALERLIEIAIVQKDDTDVGTSVAALDRISAGLRLPSVPYIRGKLAYSQDKHDEAIAYFQDVPKGSDYEMQAAYYMATTYVAKKDVQRATEIFTDLIGKKPRTANDRRIVELSQLALGRLYYERDQASKSIDSYLLVDRHSDLFPDALYEVAWVYVKSKQYDKALRALELLSRSDPQSTKTPTVRILEGNLRIRKAQMIRGAQILGTLDNKEPDDPATEYDKAVQVFTETHDIYLPSYAALAQMVDSKADPAQYLTQIAGRSEHVFQAVAPIPEAAVQYLRDEPEVQRVVAVETDLGDINANLAETEATIARLEGVLAAADKTAVYPALASRRSRISAIQGDLIKLRDDLAEQALRLVDSSGGLAPLSARRKQLFASYAAMPDAEHVAAERLAQTQAQYDAIELSVAEVSAAIGATQAVAVALHKYGNDMPDLPADQRKTVAGALDDAAKEALAIEDALDDIHKEIQIGRDLAGVSDDGAPAARAARKQLKAALDAEHKVLAGLASASRDRGKSQKLAQLGDRAARLADQLDQTDHQIEAVVAQGLAEVRVTLAQEQTTLHAYKAELAGYEAETRSIGGSVLAASEQTVKAKFYDIVIRTDVGNVDVSWSRKEDTDDDLKRLNLSRQRELKQLKDEFKDILDAGTPKPSAPAKKLEMPQPEPNPPSGSPDKGAGDQRIAPGSDKPSTPAAPTVRPGDPKADPKKADPKKADPKKADPKKADPKKAGAPKGGSR